MWVFGGIGLIEVRFQVHIIHKGLFYRNIYWLSLQVEDPKYGAGSLDFISIAENILIAPGVRDQHILSLVDSLSWRKQYTRLLNMCEVKFYKSEECGHEWAILSEPCKEGRDLLNCPTVQNKCRKIRPPRGPPTAASCKECPLHGLQGDYDMKNTRMVKKTRTGYRIGFGPGKRQPGTDFVCCVIQ
ncbi:hypothetical protein L228DRAFT_95056 [Xylona heveae TC161]|uniref:Uncharacterized protein n=1 Tax=Xylona heveae (strain CBS 132557 / TC161) TaxID=1328760 RepID=A0A165I415_XYLHT|nr:hypothetical protein L228DRAFT_95056 [Xylona heveae TC161]KZF24352.1 hypothetical protein L228DRAFT_95056 [Xylona heveae TC161]